MDDAPRARQGERRCPFLRGRSTVTDPILADPFLARPSAALSLALSLALFRLSVARLSLAWPSLARPSRAAIRITTTPAATSTSVGRSRTRCVRSWTVRTITSRIRSRGTNRTMAASMVPV